LYCPEVEAGRSTLSPPLPLPRQRDDVDLHQRAPRQPARRYRSPRRRLLLEEGAVLFVHRAEVIHIGQEDRALHHAVERGARRLQQGLHVLQHPPRLLFDIAAHQLLCAGIQGDLPGEKQESTRPRRLRVRSNGAGRSVSADDLSRHVRLLALLRTKKPPHGLDYTRCGAVRTGGWVDERRARRTLELLQQAPPAEEPGHHRADGDAEDLRDLLVREALEVGQDNGGAEGLGQRGQGLFYVRVHDGLERDLLRVTLPT